VKVDVVDDLDVVRLSAALQEQPHECVALRVRKPVFFTFADDSDQRSVATVASHEIRVRIGASIEQCACDGNGVVACRGQWKSREAEKQERLPIFRTVVPEQIAGAPAAGAIVAGRGSFLYCRPRVVRQYALDLFQVAADNRCVETVVHHFGKPFQNTHRGVSRHAMRGAAPDMVVGAGVLEKALDRIRCLRVRACVASDLVLERRPTGETVLQRKRALYVAQGGHSGGIRQCSLETSARFFDIRAKRFEPTLRFPLQVLEGAPRRELPGHGHLPPVAA
jgi:hypothetical protein